MLVTNKPYKIEFGEILKNRCKKKRAELKRNVLGDFTF